MNWNGQNVGGVFTSMRQVRFQIKSENLSSVTVLNFTLNKMDRTQKHIEVCCHDVIKSSCCCCHDVIFCYDEVQRYLVRCHDVIIFVSNIHCLRIAASPQCPITYYITKWRHQIWQMSLWQILPTNKSNCHIIVDVDVDEDAGYSPEYKLVISNGLQNIVLNGKLPFQHVMLIGEMSWRDVMTSWHDVMSWCHDVLCRIIWMFQ